MTTKAEWREEFYRKEIGACRVMLAHLDAGPTSLSDERESFDRIYLGGNSKLAMKDSTTGDYVSPAIRDAYAGWQARALLAAPQPDKVHFGPPVPSEGAKTALPELPEPIFVLDGCLKTPMGFSASQMREYGAACIQAAGDQKPNVNEDVALMREALELIELDIKEAGGCDHSVGICMCQYIHVADQLRARVEGNKS